MKIIQTEISIAHNLTKKYKHISTIEILIDLAAQLEIHIQVMESARDRWNKGLEEILASHQIILDKYKLTTSHK